MHGESDIDSSKSVYSDSLPHFWAQKFYRNNNFLQHVCTVLAKPQNRNFVSHDLCQPFKKILNLYIKKIILQKN